MGKVIIIAEVFFTLDDVAKLLKAWASDAPLVAPIDQFITQLKVSIAGTRNQIAAIEMFVR